MKSKKDPARVQAVALAAKTFRLSRFLTVRELSGMMGVSDASVVAWETGHNSVPIRVALRMSQLSGQPVSDFISKSNADIHSINLGHGYILDVVTVCRRFGKNTLI